MLTKVNPKVVFPQFSNIQSQILKKNLNLKSTTLVENIPCFGTDRIDENYILTVKSLRNIENHFLALLPFKLKSYKIHNL